VGRFHTDTEVHTMTKIPGELWFSLDIRSQDNEVLMTVDREIRAVAREIGERRGVTIDLGEFTNSLPGPIDKDHLARLERLAGTIGVPALSMASGAGHDSAVFGRMGVPTAMIFIRNEHGSHNPDEAMDLADFALGLKLLVAAVEEIDGS
jgi:N-carbamoyl-L-amino-acid hydrolase